MSKKVSKPGAIGNNMAGALKGTNEASISENYKGKPRNAIPNHPHNPNNSTSVKNWTQNHMQEQREKAKNKQ